MSETRTLGILGHLRELRKRLLWCVIAIVVGMGIAFWQSDFIIELLKKPAGDITFIYLKLTEGFSVAMRVSFIGGIIIAMPVVMYQLLMFIIPALTPREKRTVFLILPWIVLMFFGGVFFGWYFIIPPALKFLLGFGTEVATYMPNLGDYINFVSRLILLLGLMFEMPVLTTFLTRIGVISYRWLANKRKIWIVLSFVVSAIITPTPDAVNQSIVAGTLIVLYEISIWLAWTVDKNKKKIQN